MADGKAFGYVPPVRAEIMLVTEDMPPLTLSGGMLELRRQTIEGLPPEMRGQFDGAKEILGVASLSVRELLVEALAAVDQAIANDPMQKGGA